MTTDLPSNWTTPSLQRFRQRVLGWTTNEINSGWEDIIVPQGAAEVGVVLGDEELLSWAEKWFDEQLESGFRTGSERYRAGLQSAHEQRGVMLNDYCGSWGMGLALSALIAKSGSPKYSEAIVRMADFAMKSGRRAPDGTIAHGGFSDNIWVDTLYYCAPLFATAFQATEDEVYSKEALRQCVLHAKHLRDEHTGLWHHDANPASGVRTVNYWGRGNGWIIAALADTLTICPTNTEGYAEVMHLYRSVAEALLGYQHANGMWRVVPEDPESHLETSATSMILHGLAVGVREGWLETFVLPRIQRGYNQLQTWIRYDGSLMGSQHPSGRGGWDNLKLTPFGETSYTSGFMLRLAASLHQAEIKG